MNNNPGVNLGSTPVEKIKAFSLTEILVVITIIGILASVAIPSYRRYVIESKISTTLPLLSLAIESMITGYKDSGGFFPNSIETAGGTLNLGGILAQTTLPNVAYMHYYASGTSGYICADFSANLGISEITNVGTGNNGTKNRICMRTYIVNDIALKYCGTWSTGNTDLPAEYLPSNCNCTVISSGGPPSSCS